MRLLETEKKVPLSCFKTSDLLGNNFAFSMENECRRLVFLLFWTNLVELYVKK